MVTLLLCKFTYAFTNLRWPVLEKRNNRTMSSPIRKNLHCVVLAYRPALANTGVMFGAGDANRTTSEAWGPASSPAVPQSGPTGGRLQKSRCAVPKTVPECNVFGFGDLLLSEKQIPPNCWKH